MNIQACEKVLKFINLDYNLFFMVALKPKANHEQEDV
jgi:hypothetical protein